MSSLNFIKICEAVLMRTERGGFLVGDVVEISNFNDVDDHIRDDLKALVDQGLNIKIIDIVNKYPSAQPGSQQNNTGDVTLVVGADYGGGRYVGRFTVPPSCCKVISSYPNLDPVPDALKRDNVITIKPEPVPGFENEEFTKQTNHADSGSGLKRVEDKLRDKNTNQPGPRPPKYAPHFKK